MKDVKRFLSKAVAEDYGGEWGAEQSKNSIRQALDKFWTLPESDQQAVRVAFAESQAPIIRTAKNRLLMVAPERVC